MFKTILETLIYGVFGISEQDSTAPASFLLLSDHFSLTLIILFLKIGNSMKNSGITIKRVQQP